MLSIRHGLAISPWYVDGTRWKLTVTHVENTKEWMHCHCCTKTVQQWAFMDSGPIASYETIRPWGVNILCLVSCIHHECLLNTAKMYIQNQMSINKDLPRVNRAYDPAEDPKRQLLSFSEISLEFCCILLKLYKNLHFTEFHSLSKDNFEEKSYILPLLYLMENGKVFFLKSVFSP